jgi:hypothetical protein
MVNHLPSGMVPALPGHTSPCTALPGHTKPCQPHQAPPSLATPSPTGRARKVNSPRGLPPQAPIHPLLQSLEGGGKALIPLNLEDWPRDLLPLLVRQQPVDQVRRRSHCGQEAIGTFAWPGSGQARTDRESPDFSSSSRIARFPRYGARQKGMSPIAAKIPAQAARLLTA